MKTLREYLLTERFVNYFLTPTDIEARRKCVDEVWDIIQETYRKIGGVKGRGLQTKEQMITTIEMWKLKRSNGKIVTAVLYRDKKGRKSVVCATDGSPEGKAGLAEIFLHDLKQQRAYFELSDPLLGFIQRNVGKEFFASHLIKPEKLGKELQAVDENHPLVRRYPHFKEYFYSREIGGVHYVKIAFGFMGNPVKVPGTLPDK